VVAKKGESTHELSLDFRILRTGSSRKPRWKRWSPVSVGAPGADSAVRAIHHQPAAEGVYAEIPAAVDARLRAALEKRGISRLYAHQADAFDEIARGRTW